MTAQAPFFIVGLGRSGTTLLRLMLHNHPHIAIPYESHFITKYYQHLDEYGDLNEHANLRQLLADILDEELIQKWDHQFATDRLLEKLEQNSLAGVISAIYQDYAESRGKRRWGDKSDYLDRMHIINQIFPTAQFIHIIRDGRDVANSVLKMPWGPSDLIQAAEWWHEHIRLGRCMGSILGPQRYLEVKYEDLVDDPEQQLTRICDFIGEPYSPEMLNYHQHSESAIPDDRKFQHYNAGKAPVKGRTFAWRKEMSPTLVEIFNNYAWRSLQELGYDCPASTAGRLSITAAKVKILLQRLM